MGWGSCNHKGCNCLGYEVKPIKDGHCKRCYHSWDEHREKPSGGCFITTATLNHLGTTDDDCKELTLLRDFRDKYMLATEEDAELVNRYYELAPILVAKIEANEERDSIYAELWSKCIEPCISKLQKGEFQEAKILYISYIEVLEKEVSKIKNG